ncbi:GNAT family N-acetyltransferase [Kitasatospora sp. NPDC049285]|uniref:GNAT family N-acetyltransferase n=1 Tax=Kitasatospora sp. NPDC049285 TaxID=3157096 RepID=UPI00344AB769
MTTRIELPAGYEVSTDAARLDRGAVHRWLAEESYWAAGRARETQETAIGNSLNFGVYEVGSGAQVGYARVVTDGATFGWLCDVFVAEEARGRGLGTALAAAVRDHLAGMGLRRLMLATRDAHEVYAKVGFEPMAAPEKWMIIGAQ